MLVAIVVSLLGACASTPPAPVEDRSLGGYRSGARDAAPAPARRTEGEYRVRRGDTLYSIAFRIGLDYRELARANRIEPPYTIFVDQVIRLDGKPMVRQAPPPIERAGSDRSTAANPQTVRAPTRTAPKMPSVSTSPGSAPTPAVAAAPRQPETAPSSRSPAESVDTVSSGGIAWRWPADGRRDGGFVSGDQTRQGINISGKAGDPVRAAADGVVVYSGNGLIGYGELIIIKHNTSMLSAYGHNRRRLVQEGDRIKAGQQIAEMGSSSASRDMLHFEIRRNGKPIDPLSLLPAR
jgi:lipoprotein NlpD